MRILTNERLYKRNTRLAFAANLGGMFFLVASVYVLFSGEEQFGLYLLFLILGILFMQMGIYFNRWNRRPDLALNQALNSLDNNYTLYHYRTPVSHLLLGPTGIWILLPRHTRGMITYDIGRKRWRAKGGGLLSRFGQEGVGKPLVEASWEAEALDKFLEKRWKDGIALRVQAALVFVGENTDVQAGNAPIPTASVKKIKQILLKADEKSRLNREQINALSVIFEKK
ncbi:MAG: hypothetical protein WD740_04045 [Anaerolineales bacterium]